MATKNTLTGCIYISFTRRKLNSRLSDEYIREPARDFWKIAGK
jgi:hypothetical protein